MHQKLNSEILLYQSEDGKVKMQIENIRVHVQR